MAAVTGPELFHQLTALPGEATGAVAAQAWRALLIAALAVVLCAVLAEPRIERRRERRREQARPEPAPGPQPAEPEPLLDVAYALATEQYLGGLETGQGGLMPSREQVARDIAAVGVEHDQVELSTEECLRFAGIAAGFDRAFRPPIPTDLSDPDGQHRW